jgi:hypothetical protein
MTDNTAKNLVGRDLINLRDCSSALQRRGGKSRY